MCLLLLILKIFLKIVVISKIIPLLINTVFFPFMKYSIISYYVILLQFLKEITILMTKDKPIYFHVFSLLSQ